ncbi:MAG TPA: iron-sulfur cluster assembly protein [Verrucomicrobiota bacterium]|nr:iron-sulfur cluster assembly protein [Verrucomicrobiota bacterium]HNU52455.1 iron-sulfur cluster assembly protein [Verrucomicrobiota bacterium]
MACEEHRSTPEAIEPAVWRALRGCYDPEIPVNIVDLGLIYSCRVEPAADGKSHRVHVQMTLTTPGCGMGPVIQRDVWDRVLAVPGVSEAQVELVWDPPWTQAMMSESARLELGLL